ncbi:MAG TPA: MBL fold metallo-hydrolase [Streptosporangiaceae bacterium]|jgi:L-ascorbate metabolism protein UlaG (beta-lactamase superfamily)
MRLTKLGHSCVRLEKNGGSLVIDPGVWSGPDAAASADAILITHEHPDHVDGARVATALTGRKDLELWASATVAGQFAEFGGRIHTVDDGDVFQAAGFDVHVYGHDHAVIHPDVPVVVNTGFAVDGQVFHPGDSLTVPREPVPVLLIPVNAPWLKVSEMIDYGRAVAPSRGYAIHDGLLNENGLALAQRLLGMAAGSGGGTFSRLEPGTSVEI